MAKALTPIERRKKNQRLILVMAVVFLLTGGVLFIGLRGGQPTVGQPNVVATEATRQAAQAIIQDVTIPKSFFDKEVLSEFTKYIPIAAPASWGRTDPFVSF
ncbi:MAG: hypothetical protein WD712_01500 [Candidatus Spechtbacterales bacterium]